MDETRKTCQHCNRPAPDEFFFCPWCGQAKSFDDPRLRELAVYLRHGATRFRRQQRNLLREVEENYPEGRCPEHVQNNLNEHAKNAEKWEGWFDALDQLARK